MIETSGMTPWTYENILNNGAKFLKEEASKIDSSYVIWKSAAANWHDQYNNNAFDAAANYKAEVFKSISRIKVLDLSISKALNVCDSQVMRTELTHVATFSKLALNYFNALADNSNYPSLFGKGFQWLSNASGKSLLATTTLTIVAAFSHDIFHDRFASFPPLFFTPAKTSLVAFLVINALYGLYLANNALSHSHIGNLKSQFQTTGNTFKK